MKTELIGFLTMIILTFSKMESTKASYYGGHFNGRTTASGEVFDENKMTVAHKTLKFGTKLLVVNEKNSKFVIVTVNDRGPFIKGRGLDLSKKAFSKIADLDEGVIKVKYRIL